MSISKESLLERMQRGDSVVLNILPAEEYLKKHIRGSFNLPWQGDEKVFAGEVRAKYDKGLFFVTYGSNITNAAAIVAAEALQRSGLQAEAYMSGLKEWTEARLPVEVG